YSYVISLSEQLSQFLVLANTKTYLLVQHGCRSSATFIATDDYRKDTTRRPRVTFGYSLSLSVPTTIVNSNTAYQSICLKTFVDFATLIDIRYENLTTKNLPPGPTRLPIIGNLHLLGDQPHRSLAKLAETHGPIMSLQLGQITTLVISSATAKELLQKQDLAFSSRNVPDAMHAHNHARYSVGWLHVGTEWRNLRRILNSNIFSNSSLEANQHLRSQKVEELLAYCRKASLSNDCVDIGLAAFKTSLNFLSNTVFSKDLIDSNEDSGIEFKEVIGNILTDVAKPNVVDFFPVLKKIDPKGIRRRITRNMGKVHEIFDKLIDERLRMGRFKQDDRCIGRIIEDNSNEINHTHKDFCYATHTSSLKPRRSFKKLLVKVKLIIQEDDVLRLPYLSCIIKETLRLHPPVPLLVPRKVNKEVQLNGYTIPGRTQILVNAWAIARDATIWDDSLEFKPKRFLDSVIDVRGQDFDLIPFGAGRRISPGLPLAMHTNIQLEALDMNEKFGITLSKAKPLCVIPIVLN
ncbi:hypothetical protein M8C21_028376, partial [Ambrosia artemisiifolia]